MSLGIQEICRSFHHKIISVHCTAKTGARYNVCLHIGVTEDRTEGQ